MKKITPRQQSILKFVELFIQRNQRPPSRRDIAEHFRIHRSAVHKHLNALATKGALVLAGDGLSRGVRLQGVSPSVAVPVVEMGPEALAGGMLVPVSTMMLDASFAGSEECLLLRVAGDWVIEAGIAEGDLALVRKSTAVRNGEVVACSIAGELLLRRYYNIAGRIVLEPANKRYLAFSIKDPEEFALYGRVAAIIRTLAPMVPRAKRKATKAGTEEVESNK